MEFYSLKSIVKINSFRTSKNQDQVEFIKPNGDFYATLDIKPNQKYFFVRWTGIQTLDGIKEAGNAFLEILKQSPRTKLLNSHKELIGPWDFANDWISTVWTPQIIKLGISKMAQVLAPGVYGQMSFHLLHQKIGESLEIKLFDNESEAMEWLSSN